MFLGAGCPMAIRVGTGGMTPLVPDIAGMTAFVRDSLAKCKTCGPLLAIIDSNFKKDGLSNTTVEELLTYIRSLRAVAGKDKVRGLSADDLDNLDKNICMLIHKVTNQELPNLETPYHWIAAWVDAVQRNNPIEIFTTNYDLLMEQAFEDLKVPYFDGFAGVRKPFFDLRAMEEDMLPLRWARLWKLHGSINWYQVPDKGVFRGTTEEDGSSIRVIHPSHLKYQESRRMPYLAMIDRLRAFLRKPTAMLVICGYSFRDEHINEIILQGLQTTQTTVAFALLYDGISEYSQAASLASKCPSLNILARDGGIICGQESKWLERDEESIPANTTNWIKWIPINPEDENSKRRAEFALGDFAVFGKFLQNLVGSVRITPEVSNA